MTDSIRYRRTIAKSDGGSEFIQETIQLHEDQERGGHVSNSISIKGIYYRTVVPSRDKSLELPHKAPADQYVVQLAGGGIKVGSSIGQIAELYPPTLGRVSDTTGIGHTSIALSDQPRTSLFVPIESSPSS